MARRATLAVDRMSSQGLWRTLLVSLYRLDPLDPSYSPGQTHHIALEARQIVLELRLRGTQTTLFEPKPDQPAA